MFTHYNNNNRCHDIWIYVFFISILISFSPSLFHRYLYTVCTTRSIDKRPNRKFPLRAKERISIFFQYIHTVLAKSMRTRAKKSVLLNITFFNSEKHRLIKPKHDHTNFDMSYFFYSTWNKAECARPYFKSMRKFLFILKINRKSAAKNRLSIFFSILTFLILTSSHRIARKNNQSPGY